jgi:hypothetical protein
MEVPQSAFAEPLPAVNAPAPDFNLPSNRCKSRFHIVIFPRRETPRQRCVVLASSFLHLAQALLQNPPFFAPSSVSSPIFLQMDVKAQHEKVHLKNVTCCTDMIMVVSKLYASDECMQCTYLIFLNFCWPPASSGKCNI